MRKIWKRQSTNKHQGLIGVHMSPQGMALAYAVLHPETALYTIMAHAYIATDHTEDKRQALLQFIKTYHLEGEACAYILPSSEYTLTLVDAPPVAVAERNQATRWLVREAVNFPIEQAIIDTCEIPIPRARDNAALLYAVITQSSIVSTIKQFFLKMPVTLKYIDISELALCPLMERIPEQEQGCLFLRLSPAGGKLAIYKKNALYIARSIELKLSSLMGDHAAQEIEVLESLALELQRSLDYMSSLFRQNLLSSIVLFPTLLNTLVIQNYLTNSLGMEVKVISLDQILPFETPPSLEQQMQCLVAIGASLRQIHATAH